eukprot:Platyproteum_vivax@DN2092_c0_g1_i1.p1
MDIEFTLPIAATIYSIPPGVCFPSSCLSVLQKCKSSILKIKWSIEQCMAPLSFWTGGAGCEKLIHARYVDATPWTTIDPCPEFYNSFYLNEAAEDEWILLQALNVKGVIVCEYDSDSMLEEDWIFLHDEEPKCPQLKQKSTSCSVENEDANSQKYLTFNAANVMAAAAEDAYSETSSTDKTSNEEDISDPQKLPS